MPKRLLGLALLAIGAVASADDHGDSFRSATRVALPSETAGVIDPGNDADWFEFEISASGNVAAEISGDLDVSGALYDDYGNVLAINDDSEPFRIWLRLNAGTYYVRVTSLGSATGSYVLHLRSGAAEEDHGNSTSSATRVALLSETAGTIDWGRDSDWFGFEVSASVAVTAETTGGLDTAGALYDAAGDWLASDDDSAPGGGLNFRIHRELDAGTYFVRVGSYGLKTGSYALRLEFGPSDHGNSLSSATDVALPSETAGTIAPVGDTDWFRFEVPASGTVRAWTAGGIEWGAHLDTLGALYNAAGDELASNDDSALGRFFGFQRELDAGTYYVRVTSFVLAPWEDNTDEEAVNTGSYVLRLEFEASADAPRPQPVMRQGHLRNLGDFDGDGKDDVLLRHRQDGHWLYYRMDGRRVLFGSGAASLTSDLAWRVAGVGDFNGDDRADMLLRHEDGRWYFYPMDGRTILAGHGAADLTRDLAWRVAGIGDLDGDGKDDVLLRHEEGRWHYARMDGRRPLSGSGGVRLTKDLAWQIAGVGDFNGDGRADVLLRHEEGRWYFYPMDGPTVLAGRGTAGLTRDLAWRVVGIGDLDGDGKDDVLVGHQESGWHYFRMDGRRPLSGSGEAHLIWAPTWHVAGVGDMDGDGREDVLMRGEGTWRFNAMNGRYSDGGEARLTADAAWGVVPLAWGVAPLAHGESFRDCHECPAMVIVPAGRFTMGSELGSEGPPRTVSIPAFAASVHEVTFAEWDACVAAGGCAGYRPDDEGWGRGDRPVVNVGWNDAQLYVDWLTRSTGKRYRLLTESEWEYAARAGTRTPFHTGGTITPQQANFNGRWNYPAGEYDESGFYREQTVPVGSFAPNGFGLHDMHGNVWEWVQDCYNWAGYWGAPSDGSAMEGDGCKLDWEAEFFGVAWNRVFRGGSWFDKPSNLRSAYRDSDYPNFRAFHIGFRVARTL